MVILFILLPKVVYLPHNTMEFFDFIHELKVNEYDQLKPISLATFEMFLKIIHFSSDEFPHISHFANLGEFIRISPYCFL